MQYVSQIVFWKGLNGVECEKEKAEQDWVGQKYKVWGHVQCIRGRQASGTPTEAGLVL